MALKTILAKKAVKTTAKHTAHGTASKFRRDPMRAASLIGLGVLIGAATVWLLSKAGGSQPPAPPAATV